MSESLARRLWPAGDALGAAVRLRHERAPRTVIAVAPSARHIGLDQRFADAIYVPITQHAHISGQWTLLLRARDDAASALRAAERAAVVVDPEMMLYHARMVANEVADILTPQRISAILSGAMGLFALMLTATGLAAAASYTVAQRTNEIGIRIALGASRGQVLALVLREGASATIAGTVLGLAVSVLGARVMRRLLIGTPPADLAVVIPVAAVLGLVAFAAAIVPARRASRVNPVIALQRE